MNRIPIEKKNVNALSDPMSPHASSDFGGDVMSPLTSPPATPSQMQDTEPSGLDSHRSSALQNSLRRRTMPALRLGKDDAATAFTEDENEVTYNISKRKIFHRKVAFYT